MFLFFATEGTPVPALPWRSQVQAEDTEEGSQKVQSSFAETSEDKNVKCKVVVSLSDGILILTTKRHKISHGLQGFLKIWNLDFEFV